MEAVQMTDLQFKSYLREQLEHQEELKDAIEHDIEKAKNLINKMIDRTQKGIED